MPNNRVLKGGFCEREPFRSVYRASTNDLSGRCGYHLITWCLGAEIDKPVKQSSLPFAPLPSNLGTFGPGQSRRVRALVKKK